MGKVETATRWMENLARDDSHGYDQAYRWGERGDYDCSAAIITAFQVAGVPVKSNGATYTGNMKRVFLATGFKDVTSTVNLNTGAGLIRGDVLLNEGAHTAIYIGNGQTAEASINEFGGITGGKPGDQTGYEVLIRSYRNYPWGVVLRFPEKKTITVDGWWGVETTTFAQSEVFKTPADGIISNQSTSIRPYLTHCLSSSWEFVKPEKVKAGSALVKAIQKKVGGLEVDGVFGLKTCKALQKFLGVEVDGYFGDKSVRAFQKWLNSMV